MHMPPTSEAVHAVQHLRTLIYAFDRSLEGALAACGAPLVGYLAQHAFGFTVSTGMPVLPCSYTPVIVMQTTSSICTHGDSCAFVQGSAAAGTGHDAENAAALSNALLVMTIVPWTLCVLCYCGLHFTYAADREVAQVPCMSIC
jgi:hypothetical protein